MNKIKEEVGVGMEIYLPGDKAAEIWLALNVKLSSSICSGDPLELRERQLYNALTTRFAAESQILGVVGKAEAS